MSRVTSDYAYKLIDGDAFRAEGLIDGWAGSVTIYSDEPDDYTAHSRSGGKPPKRVTELLRARRRIEIVERDEMSRLRR